MARKKKLDFIGIICLVIGILCAIFYKQENTTIKEFYPHKKSSHMKEADYVNMYCKGIVEYQLSDRTRVDCLTDEYAIEYDWAKKWAESIGQAMYYSKMTGKKPAVAIIIKNGTKDKTSIEMANEILNLNQNHDKGDINFLQDFSLEELKNIKGIGRVKAIQIKAMCELAGRMSKPSNYRKIQIKGPNDVANLLMNDLRFEKREIVKVVIINNKNIVLKILDVAIGSGNCSNLNIRYILSETVKMNAPKIILVHNHPSGDPTPTKQDIFVTEKLKEAAELLKIELLDHIVIGNMRYKSIMS